MAEKRLPAFNGSVPYCSSPSTLTLLLAFSWQRRQRRREERREESMKA